MYLTEHPPAATLAERDRPVIEVTEAMVERGLEALRWWEDLDEPDGRVLIRLCFRQSCRVCNIGLIVIPRRGPPVL